MSEDIDIIEIQLTDHYAKQSLPHHSNAQQWFDVSIVVRNHSPTKTYHIVAGIRTLRYDAPSHTLHILLSESEAKADLGISSARAHKFAPKVVPLNPGEQQTLKFSLPVILHRITKAIGHPLNTEVIDLSQLEHVRCVITFNDAPFYSAPTEPIERLTTRLQSWGRHVDKSFKKADIHK